MNGDRDTLDRLKGILTDLIDEHGESYDSDCGTYSGCFCGWDNGTDEHNGGYSEHVADAVIEALGGVPA